MCTNWKRWCRLCGLTEDNDMQLDISAKLIELARHHLLINTISSSNEWPMLACRGCVEFLLEFERFADRCRLMDKMFGELSTSQHKDILALRNNYVLEFGKLQKRSEEDNEDSFMDQTMVELDTPEHEMEHVIIKEEDEEIVCQIRRSTRNIDQNSISFNTRFDLKETREDSDFEISSRDSKCTRIISKRSDKNEKLRKNSKVKRDSHKRSKKQDAELSNCPQTKSSAKFACQPCQLAFERPGLYARHMRYHHSPEDLPLSCPQCPKRFAIPIQLRLHKNQHLSADLKFKYPCPHCGKKFTKLNSVKTHIQARHLRLRPFVCEHCGATFATKGALKDHNLTHTDERTVACSQCPKMFKSLAKVKEHELAIHSDIKFPCPHCDALLNTKKSLRTHKLVHTDETRYKCQYCGKGYKRSNALKGHLILHTGQRPFACPFCNKTYASSSNCYNHKKKCHPDEFAAMKAAENS